MMGHATNGRQLSGGSGDSHSVSVVWPSPPLTQSLAIAKLVSGRNLTLGGLSRVRLGSGVCDWGWKESTHAGGSFSVLPTPEHTGIMGNHDLLVTWCVKWKF